MKVKLDENLGQLHAELVRDAGHVAQRVTEQGLSGAKDSALCLRLFLSTAQVVFCFAKGSEICYTMLVVYGLETRKSTEEARNESHNHA